MLELSDPHRHQHIVDGYCGDRLKVGRKFDIENPLSRSRNFRRNVGRRGNHHRREPGADATTGQEANKPKSATDERCKHTSAHSFLGNGLNGLGFVRRINPEIISGHGCGSLVWFEYEYPEGSIAIWIGTRSSAIVVVRAQKLDPTKAEPMNVGANEDQPTSSDSLARDRELAAIRGLATAYTRLRQEIGKVIIGQSDVIDQLLIAMFCRSHCLLMGVPGLAKTLLVSTVARILQLSYRRIQFTPDLMPSDITGTDVLQEDAESGRRLFQFMQGPIFTNVLLADEINRTPPKTQAALLEAMQERHVTVGSNTYRLPVPFFVLATQNPIEQEGTYPLPEAQLDRFMFNIVVKYPTAAEELRILKQTTSGEEPQLAVTLTGRQILALQEVVRKVPVAEHVLYLCERSGSRYTSQGRRRPEICQRVSFVGRRATGRAEPDPRSQSTRPVAGSFSCHDRGYQGDGTSCAAPSPGHDVRRAKPENRRGRRRRNAH